MRKKKRGKIKVKEEEKINVNQVYYRVRKWRKIGNDVIH